MAYLLTRSFQNTLLGDAASQAPLWHTLVAVGQRAAGAGWCQLKGVQLRSAQPLPARLAQRQGPVGSLASRVPFNNAKDDHLTHHWNLRQYF